MKTGADCVFFHACFCFCAFLVAQVAKYSRKCSINRQYAAQRGIFISSLTLHNINVLNCVTVASVRYVYIFEIETMRIACVVHDCVGVQFAVKMHVLDIANAITRSFKWFILFFSCFNKNKTTISAECYTQCKNARKLLNSENQSIAF